MPFAGCFLYTVRIAPFLQRTVDVIVNGLPGQSAWAIKPIQSVLKSILEILLSHHSFMPLRSLQGPQSLRLMYLIVFAQLLAKRFGNTEVLNRSLDVVL